MFESTLPDAPCVRAPECAECAEPDPQPGERCEECGGFLRAPPLASDIETTDLH